MIANIVRGHERDPDVCDVCEVYGRTNVVDRFEVIEAFALGSAEYIGGYRACDNCVRRLSILSPVAWPEEGLVTA